MFFSYDITTLATFNPGWVITNAIQNVCIMHSYPLGESELTSGNKKFLIT